ncbi:UNVERIFIED_CONTAM: hypothetical protein NY100_00450 [Prevotella sp. 15_C9]
MNKTETGAAGVKAAYVCPRIVCYAAESEYSLCAVSPIGGGAGTALPDPEGDLIEEEEP